MSDPTARSAGSPLNLVADSRHIAQGAAERRTGARWRGKVKRLGDLADTEIALWHRLVGARHELRSPFFSYEFARTIADAGADARVCLLHDDGVLAGFLPFQFADGSARLLAAGQRIGGALNDFCGVVIDASRHGPIGPDELLRCAELASFEVSHLEENQTKLGLSFTVPSEGARIQIGGDLDAYWRKVKSTHPSDHETLNRRRRKVARESRSVEFVFAHKDPGALVHEIVAEKRKQYERTDSEDGFAEPWKLRCLERIAQYRDGRCLPVVSALYLDGQWAALHFGIRAGSVLHYWFPVYKPELGGLSPGLILLANIISEAASHAIDEIDLGEGLSRYKSVFGTEFYPIYRDFWSRTTLRGLLNRGRISLRWHLRALQAKKSAAVKAPHTTSSHSGT
jgi:CelD/BcsL family acetyltransferase involved in cellulose biosynthesis